LNNLSPTRPSQATQELAPQPQRQTTTESAHPGDCGLECGDMHHDSSRKSVSTITPEKRENISNPEFDATIRCIDKVWEKVPRNLCKQLFMDNELLQIHSKPMIDKPASNAQTARGDGLSEPALAAQAIAQVCGHWLA